MLLFHIVIYYIMSYDCMLCYVMSYYVMLCYVMLCYIILYYMILGGPGRPGARPRAEAQAHGHETGIGRSSTFSKFLMWKYSEQLFSTDKFFQMACLCGFLLCGLGMRTHAHPSACRNSDAYTYRYTSEGQEHAHVPSL